jgi:hypothetical protein
MVGMCTDSRRLPRRSGVQAVPIVARAYRSLAAGDRALCLETGAREPDRCERVRLDYLHAALQRDDLASSGRGRQHAREGRELQATASRIGDASHKQRSGRDVVVLAL